ncbi:hypothetical protein [Flavivirga spongiicola]|uniref:DUF2062 domain-containing protein n=1 Tax=Flavivirga spongiicola TaxID=421621 RepID=A0ABU7XNB1_9FLAO|nr:hypothetical protein [Flavivirga sp. MEBiC05379]MDO5981592.1 hypothetical protein [Flavivirga sp. MEBiC05379]
MDETEKRSLLKDEYFNIQSKISDFDSKALTIKTWSISFSLAAMVAAFSYRAPLALLLGSISAIVFWILEAYWKTFQYAFYKRGWQIEDFFEGKNADIIPLQIGKSFSKNLSSNSTRRFFRVLFWRHVLLPHIFIFIIGLVIYFINPESLTTAP